MASVKILSVTHIAPPRPALHPLSIPLSVFDILCIKYPPVECFFVYPEPNFHAVVDSLKASLSRTLRKFYPFVGTLAYVASSGEVVVDCSPDAVGDGLAFTEAEVDGGIDRLLTEDNEKFGLDTLVKFVPDLGSRDFPRRVMAVQVTGFSGGGVVVGLAVDHAATDGRGIWDFLEDWGAECRGVIGGSGKSPAHGRAVIKHPRTEEIARRVLTEPKPDLPVTKRFRLHQRSFTVSPTAIQSLKQRIVRLSDDPSGIPSTFLAIVSHAWVSVAAVIAAADTDTSTLSFSADCRSRLNPPTQEAYTGNCMRPLWATATLGDLRGPRGISVAHRALTCGVQEAARDPLNGCEEWLQESYKILLSSGRVLLAGSPRFRISDIDFGWGKPARFNYLPHIGPRMAMFGGEDGQVQFSVALDPSSMDLFARMFVAGLYDDMIHLHSRL